jgi:hypothetical protein
MPRDYSEYVYTIQASSRYTQTTGTGWRKGRKGKGAFTQDIAKGAIDYHDGPPAKSRGYGERLDRGSLQIDHCHASRSAPIIGYAHYRGRMKRRQVTSPSPRKENPGIVLGAARILIEGGPPRVIHSR